MSVLKAGECVVDLRMTARSEVMKYILAVLVLTLYMQCSANS